MEGVFPYTSVAGRIACHGARVYGHLSVLLCCRRASESAVMRRALVAAGVCGFGYVVGIWCAVQPDREEEEEEEEEANGGRETISARLKLAGCALAALVLLAYPSIQRFLAGGRSLAECVAEVIVRLMVVACVVFPVWRTVKRRQEENGTV